MTEPIIIPMDQEIAAVKFKGKWRFFHDDDWMFILNYRAYRPSSDEEIESSDFRRNTWLVDENNAEEWMSQLVGELTPEQIPYAVNEHYRGEQARLVFVIDFDRKLWVGCGWSMDQSALEDYQPEGWTAKHDYVFLYVPEEVANLWGKSVGESC
jgi:hypothetical protein